MTGSNWLLFFIFLEKLVASLLYMNKETSQREEKDVNGCMHVVNTKFEDYHDISFRELFVLNKIFVSTLAILYL
jgi:hypothetical protein